MSVWIIAGGLVVIAVVLGVAAWIGDLIAYGRAPRRATR